MAVQKKLLSIFGIDSKGHDMKELREAQAVTAGVTADKKKGGATMTRSK